MKIRHSLASLAFASLLFAPGPTPARADALPPDVLVCDMAALGSSCPVDGQQGACTLSTCTRIDYAHWDRDASASPPSMEYECARCIVGGPSDAGAPDASASPTPHASGCTASPAGQAGVSAAALLLGLVTAVVVTRRRR